MSSGQRYATSPMLFAFRGASGRLTLLDGRTGRRSRLTGTRGAQIIAAFLEPRTVAAAETDGFTSAEVEAAIEAGLIVAEEDADRLGLWERAGWSRPAYLMFSQTNLEYVESGEAGTGRRELTDKRRTTVESYQQVEDYPAPKPLATGPSVELPPPRQRIPGLEGLVSRRSARAFAAEPPGAQELADVLFSATAGHRLVAEDRSSGDSFRLLNSLYSWAHLFVVVQDVQELSSGVFEYDWAEHRLLRSAPAPTDEDLVASVQGQRWILGPGFAVFLVADLRGYAWLYRHSRAYIHVLIQVGELAQEILMAATELGLGGWTSPAVHESRSARLLGLGGTDGIDVLSMTKLGYPLRRRDRD